MFPELLFWISIILIFYAYFGYPLVIVLLSFFAKTTKDKQPITPTVSLLITAYNEEKDIERKLQNSLSLDYPKDKFEIVVASDGSTDATDAIVRRYEHNSAGIKLLLYRVEGRVGKTAAQNAAVPICNGEIIVFSDAASMYDRGAIRALVRNYADPEIGAVSGRCIYINRADASAGLGTIIFATLESFIKTRQTKIKTITGCTGCIYSLRKALYTPLPARIISDLVEPLTIIQRGYRIAFEPAAIAYEQTAGRAKEEFAMRIRVIVRGMTGMIFVRSLFNPFKYPYVSYQLISHKILRWLVPIFSLLLLASNTFLTGRHEIFLGVLLAQLLFYLLALVGFVLEKKQIHLKIFYLPLYFCIVNLASLISMFEVLRNKNIVTWHPQRQ